MKAKNVNKAWAMSVTFDEFCKEQNIKTLDSKKQLQLYFDVTGKKPTKCKEPKKSDKPIKEGEE